MTETAGEAKITRRAVVRFQVAGFHCWPDAPAWRAYLRERHRHLFHVEVSLEVLHNEREVEFHDLLQWSREQFETGIASWGELDGKSCETMAEELIQRITRQYPNRRVKVSVFEDARLAR